MIVRIPVERSIYALKQGYSREGMCNLELLHEPTEKCGNLGKLKGSVTNTNNTTMNKRSYGKCMSLLSIGVSSCDRIAREKRHTTCWLVRR